MERNIYRIIDANFNRAREGCRTMEEFCRFALNSKPLSSRAKQIRHTLSKTIDKLDTGKLIASRDSATDVGRGLAIDKQMTRKTLTECFIAASKRLGEALRVLAETAQTIDPDIASKIENLRFEAYALEKDALLFADGKTKYENVRLYVLITATPKDTDSDLIELTRKIASSGADCIQLRPKGLTDKRTLTLSKAITEICRKNKIISIINDRVDIACLSGADGVHLGQDDISIAQARKMQTYPLIIGLSTHNTDQLQRAIEDGAHYVGIGPAFETATKPHEKVAGLDYVSAAMEILKDTSIGHAVIGGISAENIPQILNKGVKTLAICSAITKSPDPAAETAKIRQIITNP